MKVPDNVAPDFVLALESSAGNLVTQLVPDAEVSAGLLMVNPVGGARVYSYPDQSDFEGYAALQEAVQRWRTQQQKREKTSGDLQADDHLVDYMQEFFPDPSTGHRLYFADAWISGHFWFVYCLIWNFDAGEVLALEDTPLATAPSSLVDGALREFVGDAEKALHFSVTHGHSQGRFPLLHTDELLRRSGQALMSWLFWAETTNPTWLLQSRTRDITLFDSITSIASMDYEGHAASGQVVFCRNDHKLVETHIRFIDPVPLADVRGVRKLLEIARTGKTPPSLLSDGARIWGFGNLREGYKRASQDVFTVDVVARGRWRLCHADDVLMEVKHGQPSVAREELDEMQFASEIRRTRVRIPDSSISDLWKLVEAAKKQKHGTLVVISEDAANEAERLRDQAMVVDPFDIGVGDMECVTAVDGAVLLGTGGKCHAFGAILDGQMLGGETRRRGARFNSAVRYVRTQSQMKGRAVCCAIVVSEDGTVDLLPRPCDMSGCGATCGPEQ